MIPIKERRYSKKPLAKKRTDPMWTQIFELIGNAESDVDKFIDWLSDQGCDRLYWLAPTNTWKLKLSKESERRKKLKELDRGKNIR